MPSQASELLQANRSVSGVVLDHASRQPVSFAEVTARATQTFKTKADEAGRFTFGKLPPGRYSLTAAAEGYLRGRPGTADAAVVDLRQSGAASGVVLTLKRGAYLGGKVVDEAGNAVAGIRVDLLAAQRHLGISRVGVYRSVLSDSNGDFSFINVHEGTYYLRAASGEVVLTPEGVTKPPQVAGINFIYFPASPELRGGEPLRVWAENRIDGLRIRFAPARSHRRIRVTTSPAVSPSWSGSGVVRLSSLEDSSRIVLQQWQVVPSNGFVLCCVPPGTYLLEAYVRTGETAYYAAEEIITGSDGEDTGEPVSVSPTFRPLVSIPGRVVISGATEENKCTRAFRLSVEPLERALWNVEKPDAVFTSAGAFTIPAVFPDLMTLHLWGLPAGCSVASVVYRGMHIEHGVLDLRAGIGDPVLEVRLSPEAARISGRCVDRTGQPAVGVAVLLPAARPRVFNASFLVRQAPLEPVDGRFAFGSLAAGEYVLACVPDDRMSEISDSMVLDELYASGKRLKVHQGEVIRDIELRLLGRLN
ncbi:MAG TPA: carboxypeptidase-like regulatory domain-containing protein [Bryobacteraceae bacterium]|nr:carboxypeptidase-like regulatory domain-containing protein [Bryobacteraceae bacterium]